jgi:hypothetical protein
MDPNFRWCTNRTCSAGQIVENGRMPRPYFLIARAILPFRLCDMSIQILLYLPHTSPPSSFLRGEHDGPPPPAIRR